jgi:beta-glucosidase
MDFPDGFLWGAATSSHQVEGGNTNNDWWHWEQQAGRIDDGTTSGAACEWWSGRAEEDLARAAELGHGAHRMSLEWSRLEPGPGRYDSQAFARYRAILDAASKLGVKVLLTLNHFTLPRWAADRGSWCDPRLVDRFAAFASRAAEELGDRVHLWATMNEPMVLAYMAYGGKRWPPGLGSLPRAFEVVARLLVAHERAYAAIHDVHRYARVGLVLNLPRFEPSRADNALDRMVTRAQDWFFDGVVLDALETGVLKPPLARWKEQRKLARSYDWLGLNYYGRYDVRFDPRAASTLMGRHVQSPTIRTEHVDWGQPSPQGMIAQLDRLAALNVPLYVTENGINDPQDILREKYLLDHLRALSRAIARGLDVRGYFAWSLVDNFEWAEGWAPRFGLLALDRETQTRTIRPSAQVYASVCRSNRLP